MTSSLLQQPCVSLFLCLFSSTPLSFLPSVSVSPSFPLSVSVSCFLSLFSVHLRLSHFPRTHARTHARREREKERERREREERERREREKREREKREKRRHAPYLTIRNSLCAGKTMMQRSSSRKTWPPGWTPSTVESRPPWCASSGFLHYVPRDFPRL
jgi:hypothetical protein